MKCGQAISIRVDLLPEAYLKELRQLQDNVPPFDTGAARAILDEELRAQGGVAGVFEYLSAEPIASASLGQVYRATLRESGEEVAIKVQRPGVEPNIYRDLVLFRWLGGFLNNYTIRNLGCNAQLIVDEFGEKLCEELEKEDAEAKDD